jgi:hypothetical protein
VLSAPPTVDLCIHCNSQLGLTGVLCPTCGHCNDAPNVRMASKALQQEALQTRYENAVAAAEAGGYRDQFDQCLAALDSSVATFACKFRDFETIALSENELVGTFSQKVSGNMRLVSELDSYDHPRMIVEAILFPNYGDQIRYAALSLERNGMTGYGEVTAVVSETSISKA